MASSAEESLIGACQLVVHRFSSEEAPRLVYGEFARMSVATRQREKGGSIFCTITLMGIIRTLYRRRARRRRYDNAVA